MASAPAASMRGWGSFARRTGVSTQRSEAQASATDKATASEACNGVGSSNTRCRVSTSTGQCQRYNENDIAPIQRSQADDSHRVAPACLVAPTQISAAVARHGHNAEGPGKRRSARISSSDATSAANATQPTV